MNETITIDGKDYEVLTLDRIGEITHARLAGGKVVKTLPRDDVHFVKVKLDIAYHDFFYAELDPLGIQPLKLIERKPVEVIGKFTGVEVYADAGYEVAQFMVPLGTGKLIGRKMDMKLVQITEEA